MIKNTKVTPITYDFDEGMIWFIWGDEGEMVSQRKLFEKIRGFYHDSDMIKVITGVRREISAQSNRQNSWKN